MKHYNNIQLHIENKIGLITINREKQLNALNKSVLDNLSLTLDELNYNKMVRALVITGQGNKSFVAGADIKEFHGILKDIPKMVSLTKEIVKSTNLPVTVKTRLGWDENTKYIVDVAERLQDVGIQAISIHGRTRKQMYKG